MENLPITVPQSLHDEMAKHLGEPFAVSYLCGAIVDRGVVFPRTEYACEKLLSTPDAMKVLKAQGLKLGRAQRAEDRIEIPAVSASLARYERTGRF